MFDVMQMPRDAAGWMVTKVLGRSLVDSAWLLCWFHGAATGFIAGLLAIAVPLLVVVFAACFYRFIAVLTRPR